MSDNAHMKQADSNMVYADSISHTETPLHAALWMNRAQVEATLALAYEQRTANLIAMFHELRVGATKDSLLADIQNRLDIS